MAIDVFCRFLPDILLLTKAPVFVWFDGTIIVCYYYPLTYQVCTTVSSVLLCLVALHGDKYKCSV